MSALRSLRLPVCLLALVIYHSGCSAQTATQPIQIETSAPTKAATATVRPATATNPPATPTYPLPTNTPLFTFPTPGLAGYPLAEGGPYFVGRRNIELVDASRDNRPVSVIVWYPALLSEGSNGNVPMREADPDFSGAPYPVILSDTKAAGIFVSTLVSHGFTWISVSKIDTYNPWDENLFRQPLDQLFALDQVSANPPVGLEGMLDTDHVGTTGYSFGGYNALALGGPRIDPDFYLGSCQDEDTANSGPVPLWDYICAPAERWDEFTAAAGEKLTQNEDGLWQPMTDERIKALAPLAGEGWWLYGEKGLASVNRPTLIIAATNDGLYDENAWFFEHLETPDTVMISFIGPGHMMIYEPDMIARMAHFMTAFFGYHLKGQEDLNWYFSEEFVNQHGDLAWGVFQGD